MKYLRQIHFKNEFTQIARGGKVIDLDELSVGDRFDAMNDKKVVRAECGGDSDYLVLHLVPIFRYNNSIIFFRRSRCNDRYRSIKTSNRRKTKTAQS